MTSRIRLLITIVLLLAILCVCASHYDMHLLATALRAAQAAMALMLALVFFAKLLPSLFEHPTVATMHAGSPGLHLPSQKPPLFAALLC